MADVLAYNSAVPAKCGHLVHLHYRYGDRCGIGLMELRRTKTNKNADPRILPTHKQHMSSPCTGPPRFVSPQPPLQTPHTPSYIAMGRGPRTYI